MADNEILLKFGLDQASFKKLIDDFAKGVKDGLTSKDLDIGKSLFSGRSNLAENIAIAIKSAIIESKLSDSISREMLIGAQDGAKSIAESIKLSLAQSNLSKLTGEEIFKGAQDGAKGISESIQLALAQSKLSTLVGNEITRGAQDGAKNITEILRAANLQGRTQAFSSVSSGTPTGAVQGLINFPQLSKEATTYLPNVQKRFEDLSTSIRTLGTTAVTAAKDEKTLENSTKDLKDKTEEGETGFKKFAFSAGLVGYGLENLGRRFLGFSQILFNFISTAAQSTESIERMRNALIVQGVGKDERETIESRLLAIANLPTGKLDSVTKAFKEFTAAGLDADQAINLLQGIQKGAAVEGKVGGAEASISAIQRALISRESPFPSKRAVGGLEADVGDSVRTAFEKVAGGLDTTSLTKAGGKALILQLSDELNKINTGLPVTQDRINRIENTLTLIKADLLQLIGPALDGLLSKLESFEIIAKKIKEGFDGLSPSAKSFVSSLLSSLPVVTAVIGSLLTALGVLGVALAVGLKSWKIYGEILAEISKSTGIVVEDLTILGAVGNKLTSIFSGVSDTFTGLFSEGLFGDIILLPEAVDSLFVGLGKVVGLIPGLGTILNIIIAYIFNINNARDSINSSVSDIIDSFKHLYKAVTQFGSTTAGSVIYAAIVAPLGLVLDILTEITGFLGNALGAIVGLIGDVIDLIANLLDAFSGKTWGDILSRLGTSLELFAIKVFQRLASLITKLLESLFTVVGNFMVRLHLIDQGAVDDVVKSLEKFKVETLDINLVIENGVIVRKKDVDVQKEQALAVKDLTALIKEQKDAYISLASAAAESRKAVETASAKGEDEAVKKRIEAVKGEIQDLQRGFDKALTEEFDPNKIQGVLDFWEKGIRAKNEVLIKLQDELFEKQALESIHKIANGPLGKAATDELTALITLAVPGGDQVQADNLTVAKQSIEVLRLTQSYKDAIHAFATFKKTANEGLPDIPALQEIRKNLNQLGTQLISDTKNLLDSNLAESEILNQSTKKTTDTMAAAAKSREDVLHGRVEAQKLSLEAETIDTQINTLKNNNAILDQQAANFELTTSRVRLLRAENDKKIAELERDRDKAKVQKELNVIQSTTITPSNPQGDIVGIQEKEHQLAQIDARFSDTINSIDSKVATAIQTSSDKVKNAGLQRLANAAQDILKIIDPFNEAIIRTFTLGQQNFDLALPVFVNLKKQIKDIAGDVPEIHLFLSDITDAQTTGDVNKLVDAFVRLKTNALDDKFILNLKKVKESIQALLFSDIFQQDENGLVQRNQGNSLFLDALGIGPETLTTTKADIQTALNKLGENVDFKSFLKLGNLLTGADTTSKEEIEDMLSLLATAKATNAEIVKSKTDSAKEVNKIFDNTFLQIQTEKITAQIKANDAEIAKLQDENGNARTVQNQIILDKLRVQQIDNNFQISDLNLIFNARERKRQTEDGALQLQIDENLKNDRIKLKQEEENKIRAITGESTDLKPVTIPSGVPGAAQTNTTRPRIVSLTPGATALSNYIAQAKAATAATAAFQGSLENLADVLRGKTLSDLTSGLDKALNSFKTLANGTQQHVFKIANAGMLLKDVAAEAFVGAFTAIAGALSEFLQGQDTFLGALGKLFGQILISLGNQIIALTQAAVAQYALNVFLTTSAIPGVGVFAAFGAAAAAAAAAELFVLPFTLIGAGLILAGSALGGSGSSTSKQTSDVNATNSANAQTGATGSTFDPNTDPKTIYQKALRAQILIDIKTDSGQIVKTVIKEVNGNGRLATLIGNRKLQFGY